MAYWGCSPLRRYVLTSFYVLDSGSGGRGFLIFSFSLSVGLLQNCEYCCQFFPTYYCVTLSPSQLPLIGDSTWYSSGGSFFGSAVRPLCHNGCIGGIRILVQLGLMFGKTGL